nr:hypothetical protein MarFTME_325 [Marseillevirus futianmevirus]
MSEQNSFLLPLIRKHLEEDYLLPTDGYFPKVKMCSFFAKGEFLQGLEVIIWLPMSHSHRRLFLCGWIEESTDRIFCTDCGIMNEKKALEVIKNGISTNRKIKKYVSGPLFLERTKTKRLREKVEMLQEKIETLKQKKRELKYRPGAKGALNAQRHFSRLC